MATTEFIAAIEISSSKIAGIAGKKNSDGSIQVLAYAQENASPWVRKGVINNIDKTAQAITSIVHKLESQLGSSIAKVYTGIGGQSLRTLENSVSRTLDEEQKITQEFINEMCDENLDTMLSETSVLDVVPQEYRIDNTLQTDPVGVQGRHVVGQYLNLVARTTMKTNLELSFKQAHLGIADIMIAPTTLAQSLLSENEMRSGCALVDFGADTTTLSVYKNNILRYLCVLPLGGRTITRDITTRLMEEEEAEQLKLRYGDALYEEDLENEDRNECKLSDGHTMEISQLNEIIGARVEEILRNIWNLIQQSGYADKLFSGVILTGGGAGLRNLEEAFRKYNKVEKVKTIASIQDTIHGLGDMDKKDGTLCTLMALLSHGTENCCQPEVSPEPEPVPEAIPAATEPEVAQKQETPTNSFTNDHFLKELEEENRRKREAEEQRRKEREEEQRRKEEEEQERKLKEKQQKDKEKKQKKNWWTIKFESLTKEIFEDN